MGRLIDLTGLTFGRLTVIERAENSKSGKVCWKCCCSCGNEIITQGCNLKSGKTASCGCLQKERSSETHAIDIANQRFGKLVALYPTDKRSGSFIIWYCKCDCGNVCEVSSNHLLMGTTQSCGCIISKGEMKIKQILAERNIKYKSQYTDDRFRREKTNAMFRFDFALLDDKDQPLAFIEFNGIQHYQYRGTGWDTKENFERTQARDKEKYSLCEQLNIPLYIIKYDEDIETRINEVIK